MTRPFLRLTILLVAISPAAMAQVVVSPYFANGAVLQRDTEIPVWGTAPPSAQVIVTLSGVPSDTTVAGADGAWEAELPAQPAGGPFSLTIESGASTLSLTDIYIGDLWIASGQSNMEWLLFQAENGPAEALAANDSLLRQFYIPKVFATAPSDSLPSGTAWSKATTPAATELFSAVAYYTGRDLRAALGVPIGIITAAYGGGRIEEWMSTQMLNGSGMAGLNPISGAWNKMVSPILRLPVRGVMWYQGESNTASISDSEAYGDLFIAMITGWRDAFGQPDMPFVWVQLPNYGAPQTVNDGPPPNNYKWPELRAQQDRALILPHTGQVVTIDTGELGSEGKVDIHPTRKEPVGQRMALKIREVAYGETLVSGGPRYLSNQRLPDGSIAVNFSDVGSGLVNADGTLNGFTVRGLVGKYKWANAVLLGDQVVVSSPEVSEPRSVQYAYQYNPGIAGQPGTADLYNVEGFPTAPFSVPVELRLAGTYTVFGPGADYPSLAAAVEDLTAYGIQDSVRFELQGGTHVERVEFGPIAGASDTTRVTFAAASGATVVLAPTATGASTDYILRLNGSHHISISGITFQPGGTLFENAIVLEDSLVGVVIENNTFLADGTTGQRRAISTVVPLESDSLQIVGNTFSGFSTGIDLESDVATAPTRTAINGNTFTGVGTGIKLRYQHSPSILGNVIAASDSGIVADFLLGETRLERNIVSSGSVGITLRNSDGTPGMRPLAANNMVWTHTGVGTAIDLTESDYWRIWHNTVDAGNGVGSTGLSLDGGTGLSVLNNILSSRADGFALQVTSAPQVDLESDFNVLSSSGSYIGRIGLTDYATLSSFVEALNAINALATVGANTRRATAVFADTTLVDLHLTGESLGDPLLSVSQLPELLADIDGDARGAMTYAGADETGAAFFDRVVLHGPAGWRMLSLPYPDLGLGGSDPAPGGGPGGTVTPGLLEPLYTAGYPGADIDEDGTGGYANVFLFDETETSSVPNAAYSPPASNLLLPGQGFWYYMFQDEDPFTNGQQGIFPKILPASGTPLATDYTFPVTFTPTGTIPGANLLGNPYSEGLDWGAPGWVRTRVITTAYVYDPSLGEFGDYRQWTVGVGGTMTDGVIPVGQGFFTYSTGNPVELTAPASARTGFWAPTFGFDGPRTDAQQADAKSGQSPEALPHVRFEMAGRIADREHTSFAAVAISEDAELGFDPRDAYALEPASGGDALRLVAVLPGSEPGSPGLSVTTVPGAAEVPLLAEAFASGEATDATARLSWTPTNLDGWVASLKDRETGEVYSLSEAGELTVSLGGPSSLMPLHGTSVDSKSASGGGGLPSTQPLRLAASGGERFAVTLSRVNTSGETSGDPVLALHAPMPNPTRGALRIPFSLDVAQEANVTVYDALGRRVAVLADGPLAAGSHDLSLGTSALAPGLYIVRLSARESVLTRRFMVIR